MRLQLQNRHLIPLVPFLQNMKLKGERSRARSKFLSLVQVTYNDLHESELDLLKEYAVLDDEGNPKISEDGGFTLRDSNAKAYLTERNKLFSEVAEIEGGTYAEHFNLMCQILKEYDEELDGDNAALYDALFDAFEVDDGGTCDE